MSCVPINYGTLSLDNLDNGDYSGSRQLLWVLDYTKKQNTCIFLVRYYSGQKLGLYRIKVFIEVALEALNLQNY